jgi:subfamily B ATP-binding cassette protein HlyB/CyaB
LFALAQFATLALPILSMHAVDTQVSTKSLSFGGIVLVGFLALTLVNAVTAGIGEIVQARLKQRMSRRLAALTMDHVSQKDPSWFESQSGSTVFNSINSLQLYLEFIVDALRAGTTLMIGIIAGTAALLLISPWLAVPGLVSLISSTALDLTLAREQRGLMSASVEASQRRHSFILSTLVQMPLIMRHGAFRRCRSEYVKLTAGMASAAGAMQVIQGWRSILVSLLKSAETIGFVTLASWLMVEGRYSIGGFVALGVYKDLLASALSSAFQLGLRHRTMGIHRLQGGRLLGGGGKLTAPTIGAAVDEGRLTVSEVAFRYGTLDRMSVTGLSFDVAPGGCLIVRGRSGSGKSTLAKLLTGIVAPAEGKILVDGQPLTFPVAGLGAVLQSDTLISGSIRENIALYRPGMADREIWEALDRCFAADFVRDMPMRLNSLVAEGMSGLSGGQRQRLLLARALAGKPRLLILDEATASLDVETEAAILANLRSLGVTLVVISHRPEVWKIGDEVIELEDGRIVAKVGATTAMSLAC